MVNQQYAQACDAGRQAAFLEAQGNIIGAAQMLESASAGINSCVTTAQQNGIPVMDQVYFSAAYLHYNAARLQLMTGWVQNAPMHLLFAEGALNQAIALNPNFAPYHASAGMIEIARQNVPEAIRAFTRAIQLNPADAFSQYMLGVLSTTQGNVTMANQCFQVAAAGVPNLPPPQLMAQQVQAAPAAATATANASENHAGFDWSQLFKTIASVADCVGKFAPAGAAAPSPSSTFANFAPGSSHFFSPQFNSPY